MKCDTLSFWTVKNITRPVLTHLWMRLCSQPTGPKKNQTCSISGRPVERILYLWRRFVGIVPFDNLFNPTTNIYSIQFDEWWMFAYDIVFVWMFLNVNDSTTKWWKTHTSQEKQLIVHYLTYRWWLLAKPSVGYEKKQQRSLGTFPLRLESWWCGGVQSVVVWLVISGQCWPASSGLAVSGRSGEEVSKQVKVTLLSSRYVMFLEICSMLVWSCFGIMMIASVFCKKTWCWKKQIESMVDTKMTWEEKATATVMWRNCVKRLELVRRAKLYRGSGNGAQRLCGMCKGWHHMLKEEDAADLFGCTWQEAM